MSLKVRRCAAGRRRARRSIAGSRVGLSGIEGSQRMLTCSHRAPPELISRLATNGDAEGHRDKAAADFQVDFGQSFERDFPRILLGFRFDLRYKPL